MKISARNQIRGTFTAITKGEAIANVVLDVNGDRLVASITVEAVRDLGIAEGSEVTAIIKASDVMWRSTDRIAAEPSRPLRSGRSGGWPRGRACPRRTAARPG
jgi:molybdopterin-binding protein